LGGAIYVIIGIAKEKKPTPIKEWVLLFH